MTIHTELKIIIREIRVQKNNHGSDWEIYYLELY